MSRDTIPALLVSSILLIGAGATRAQQTATPPQRAEQAKPQADMMAKCKAMMAAHQKMMEETRAADQRLDGLVAKMNAASGQAKTEAAAAAVTEIAAQRKAGRESMMKMHMDMMGHMSEHAQAGPGSMAMCPMMKGGGH